MFRRKRNGIDKLTPRGEEAAAAAANKNAGDGGVNQVQQLRESFERFSSVQLFAESTPFNEFNKSRFLFDDEDGDFQENLENFINGKNVANVELKANWTDLHDAARRGALDDVKRCLINWGHNPDELDLRGWTALHWASQFDRGDVIRYLVNCNANVDSVNHRGETPLFFAASEGHENAVKYLIANRASVSATSEFGWTAVHWAAKRGRDTIIDALVQAGAIVEATSDGGYAPLHLAAEFGHSWCVRVILAAGADTEPKTAEGLTPLHLAAKNNHLIVVQDLLRAGANPLAADIIGRSPSDVADRDDVKELLMNAERNGHPINSDPNLSFNANGVPLMTGVEFCLCCRDGSTMVDIIVPVSITFSRLRLILLENFRRRVYLSWLDSTGTKINITTDQKLALLISAVMRLHRLLTEEKMISVEAEVINAGNVTSRQASRHTHAIITSRT